MVAMPSACAARGASIVTARPSMAISPASARYAPLRTFINVDLPAPFSPSSTWTSPARRSKSTPSSATTPGKRLETPRISRRAEAGIGDMLVDFRERSTLPQSRAIELDMTAFAYDVLTMGRSSIDLYAHQIGVPLTEV